MARSQVKIKQTLMSGLEDFGLEPPLSELGLLRVGRAIQAAVVLEYLSDIMFCFIVKLI